MVAGSGWPVFPVPLSFVPTLGFLVFWSQHVARTQLTSHRSGDPGGMSTSSNNPKDSIDPVLPRASSGLQNEEEQMHDDIIDPLSETARAPGDGEI